MYILPITPLLMKVAWVVGSRRDSGFVLQAGVIIGHMGQVYTLTVEGASCTRLFTFLPAPTCCAILIFMCNIMCQLHHNYMEGGRIRECGDLQLAGFTVLKCCYG